MKYPKIQIFFAVVLCGQLLSGCSPRLAGLTGNEITGLKYLGEYIVPHNVQFKNTTVGGLSGLDYDKENDLFYIISDDWSQTNPARFYTAKLFIKQKLDSIAFLDVHYFLQPDGSLYPSARQNPYRTPDPEAIRYNPLNKTLVWNSEGERFIMGDSVVLQDPAIRIVNTDGSQLDSFPLPQQAHMYAEEKGLRRNGVFEGLSLADGYQSLYVSIEEPLYEDGPRAGLGDSTARTRIIKYDVDSKRELAQYAYEVDAVVRDPVPPNGFRINGISEILEIGRNKILTVERSYSAGRTDCNIRVYIADLSEATNVAALPSLQNAKYKPAEKKLLFNMDVLGMYISNIEGVSFGPQLPNGNQSLVFVADNNFRATEKTQFLLFEIVK